ncbi:MAG: phenylalanyl-tRNA synthetase beta chain, partial [Candidatus Arcticimaribacter sp.]
SVNEDGFAMTIPRYRVDVTREADVIEEVLRVYGYNNIEVSASLNTVFPSFHSKTPNKVEQIAAQLMVGQGFSEVMNNSLTNPAYTKLSKQLDTISKVNLLNPLGQDLSQLRSSILFSLLEVVEFNSNRQQKDLHIYEFGKIYSTAGDGYNESKRLGICITGNKHPELWNSSTVKSNFFDLKAITQNVLERLGIFSFQEEATQKDVFSEGLSFTLNNEVLVNFGIVRSDIAKNFSIYAEVLFADFDWDLIYKYAFDKDVLVKEISKFPTSRRDFALLIDSHVSFSDLKEASYKTDRKLLKEVSLFDVYEGKNLPQGKKSYGLSFYFSDPHKTLTDKNIDRVMQKLQKEFENNFGASLR